MQISNLYYLFFTFLPVIRRLFSKKHPRRRATRMLFEFFDQKSLLNHFSSESSLGLLEEAESSLKSLPRTRRRRRAELSASASKNILFYVSNKFFKHYFNHFAFTSFFYFLWFYLYFNSIVTFKLVCFNYVGCFFVAFKFILSLVL